MARMRRVDLLGIAGILAVHAERRHPHRAVDADGVHRRRHLVAGDFGRVLEGAGPKAGRAVAFLGVNLGI